MNAYKMIAIFSISLFLTACTNNSFQNVPENKTPNNQITTSTATVNNQSTTTEPTEVIATEEWKNYNNKKYEFTFDYPKYLKIIRDDEDGSKPTVQNYWHLKMEVDKTVKTEDATPAIVSDLSLDLTTNIASKNFEELKDLHKLGFGSDLTLVSEEDKLTATKSFFIRIWKDNSNLVYLTASTLLEPGTEINIGVSGQYNQKQEIKNTLLKIIESFK
ncbi:MAG: hypothetical protein WC415_03100 [Patescibacteria group bacterium]|jgi:hypothetical protein